MRILSGIQPSGTLHLGNYFGAIEQHIELQHAHEKSLYFIANYHAMTSVADGAQLHRLTWDVALDYLALGLDPDRALLFRQSDVPQVTELAWILGCVTGKGLLDRATTHKDKVQHGLVSSVGLYTYPVLMAADILIYRSHMVPVGEDQKQHLEMTRDMARRFNDVYEEVFPLPEARFTQGAKVPGTSKDEKGEFQKMSKSYGNTIEIFSEGKALRKRVMSIQTDSTPVQDPKDPDGCIVFTLYSLFANDDEKSEMARRYRSGGYGYGEAKTALLDKIEERFAAARARRRELADDEAYVEDVLEHGAARARELADETMDRVRDVTGLKGSKFKAQRSKSPGSVL